MAMRLCLLATGLLITGCTAAAPTVQPKGNAMARLNYVELPATDIKAARSFYEQAFGWRMTEFGQSYAATTSGDTDLGLDGDKAAQPQAPLAVIEVTDLEAALAAVERAGGTIVRPIFSFPGGRRFQFRDPSGNELAVSQPAAD
jgi:predicted enzyme related to lactoylglutathione lyase